MRETKMNSNSNTTREMRNSKVGRARLLGAQTYCVLSAPECVCVCGALTISIAGDIREYCICSAANMYAILLFSRCRVLLILRLLCALVSFSRVPRAISQTHTHRQMEITKPATVLNTITTTPTSQANNENMKRKKRMLHFTFSVVVLRKTLL